MPAEIQESGCLYVQGLMHDASLTEDVQWNLAVGAKLAGKWRYCGTKFVWAFLVPAD